MRRRNSNLNFPRLLNGESDLCGRSPSSRVVWQHHPTQLFLGGNSPKKCWIKIHYRAAPLDHQPRKAMKENDLFPPPPPPYKKTDGESQPAVNNRQNRNHPTNTFWRKKFLLSFMSIYLLVCIILIDTPSLLSSSSLGSLHTWARSNFEGGGAEFCSREGDCQK